MPISESKQQFNLVLDKKFVKLIKREIRGIEEETGVKYNMTSYLVKTLEDVYIERYRQERKAAGQA